MQGVKVQDLNAVSVLGNGTGGEVRLIERRGKHYALKKAPKPKLVAGQSLQIQNLVQERAPREKNIMAMCKSPFMVGFVAPFEDEDFSYILMEAVPGGDLAAYVQVTGGKQFEVQISYLLVVF